MGQLPLFWQCYSQNSGPRYVGNKMLRQIQNFSVFLGNKLAKKLPKTQQKQLYIMLAMASVYLSISPRTMIGFLTGGTTFAANMILFTYNTLKQEKQKIIFVFLKK